MRGIELEPTLLAWHPYTDTVMTRSKCRTEKPFGERDTLAWSDLIEIDGGKFAPQIVGARIVVDSQIDPVAIGNSYSARIREFQGDRQVAFVVCTEREQRLIKHDPSAGQFFGSGEGRRCVVTPKCDLLFSRR